MIIILFLILILLIIALYIQINPNIKTTNEISDEKLVQSLNGFTNEYVRVNGIRLHYVEGGNGPLLILLPGWAETWWEWHKIMPTLARKFHVISVDLRGMGSSSKPKDGYDKKTMASDIYKLMQSLGYDQTFIAGHDIGSQVAFSFAANYPTATKKLIMIDVAHPDESYANIKMLPTKNSFGDKIDKDHPAYVWWFAFNQVKRLPEKLLEGRYHILHNWAFDYLTKDPSCISLKDREIYDHAYNSPDAIRASNGWYQAFPQDIEDIKKYKKLTMPVLGLGATGYDSLAASLKPLTTNLTMVKVDNSGHYIPEEQPEIVAEVLTKFFSY